MNFLMKTDQKRWGNLPARFQIILVSGKAGTGKSTVAQVMSEVLVSNGILTNIVPVAYPVKECAREEFGWNGVKDDKGRALLQNIGQMGRDYNPDIWISKIGVLISDMVWRTGCVIIDDWRYPNEYEYLKNQGFYVYSVRVNAPKHEALWSTEFYNHPSETSLTDDDWYDFRIDNDARSMVELKERAKGALSIIYDKELR